MANSYTSLLRASFGTDASTALTAKYGAGVTVYFADALNVVFSCSAVCDKVLKLSILDVYYDADDYYDALSCYYGDAWTSGDTITNPVRFSGDSLGVTSTINIMSRITTVDLVLGDYFIWLDSIGGNIKQASLIGALTNGKYICKGLNSRGVLTGLYLTYCNGVLTDGTTNYSIISGDKAFNDDGYFVTSPVWFYDADTFAILKNGDGTPATITGLYNVAYKTYIVNASFYCSNINYWDTFGSGVLATSLFCPIG